MSSASVSPSALPPLPPSSKPSIILYVRESSDEPLARLLYTTLRELQYKVTLTDHVEPESTDLYLLLSAVYLQNPPDNYILIQTQPTSIETLRSQTEAYWLTERYLDMVKKASAVWDIYYENIAVWRDFYHLENVHHLPLGYANCLGPSNLSLPPAQSPTIAPRLQAPREITVIGNRRAEEWYQKHRDHLGIRLQLETPNQPYALVRQLLQEPTPPTLLLISDYEHTSPNLPLCSLFRHHGLDCIVEASRDDTCNEWLKAQGCRLLPWIRISRTFTASMRALYGNAPSTPSKQGGAKFLTEAHLQALPKDPTPPTTTGNPKTKKRKKTPTPKLDLYARNPLADVHYELLEDGGITLKLGDVPDSQLPHISLCTPTGNRHWIFCLAIRNYMTTLYPKALIEWVILDDGDESIAETLPQDPRIRYIFMERKEGEPRLSVAEKRNRLVELASHNIIAFMDDDDYYPPESLVARVKSLLKYKDQGVRCVGCRDVASYDLAQGLCAVCSNGDSYLTESSLTFTKDFWQERGFRDTDRVSEYAYFLEYRQACIRSIPFQFVTVALTHNTNTTGSVRSLDFYRRLKPDQDWDETKQLILNAMDEETQEFLMTLKARMS